MVLAMKRFKAVAVLNTDTNERFAQELERALNGLDSEGYDPDSGFSYQNGNHVVIVGKRKL